MTEEKYQNGDIYWNTYSGVFKAFDKDGNEIKFPTEGTGYQVTLDVQGILNLYEENKGLKRIEELRIAQIEKLKQENEALLKQKNGVMATNIKYFMALEEIRKITEEDRNCMNSELACCQLCDKLDLIQDKINEVLND